MIDAKIETVIFEAVQAKSNELGCSILGINGTENHVHVAVNIPPKLAVADWTKLVKGVSAHAVNDLYPDQDPRFRWQGSYGVLTFGAQALDFVLDYIANQKEHHRNNTLYAGMEQDDA